MKNQKNIEKLNNKATQVKPFIYKKPSISEISARMLVLLSIQILMLIFTKSYNSLIVVAVAIIGAVAAAALDFALTKRRLYTSITLLVQGIMIGLLLPEAYPPVTVFFLSFAVLFVFKYFCASSENTWINMVAIAVVIAWFIGRQFFPSYLVTKSMLSLKNPSQLLIQNGAFQVYSFDSTITNFLNTHLLNYLRVSLPEGYISLMWDSHSVIPAFRFNIITVVSAIFLFADGAFSLIISGMYLLIYAVLVRLFVPFLYGGFFNSGDVLLAIFTSGTLFCATFVLQWIGTTPMTVVGKMIYGILAGIISFLLVGCGTSPVEMVYMVLICNIFNLIINVVEENYTKKMLERVVAKANI